MNFPTQIEPNTANTNPLDFMTVTTNLLLTEDLKQKDTSPMVFRLTALEMTDLHYQQQDWLRVYNGGYQADEANTTKAGEHSKLFSKYATAGANKSNVNEEIEANSLALQQLLYRLQAFEKWTS